MPAATVTELRPVLLPDNIIVNVPIASVEKLKDFLQSLEIVVQLSLIILAKSDQYGPDKAMRGVVEVFEAFPAILS